MNVILLENVRKLGQLGEMVQVKAGYARNYLFPKNIATMATKANREAFESRRAELEKAAASRLEASEQRKAALEGLSLVIEARASDEGKLYGSISSHEIELAIQAKDIAISKREINLPHGPIRSVGDYELEIQLEGELTAQITISVVPEA